MFHLNMTRAFGAAAIALSVMATAAVAQQPARIRGQIEKVDGAMLTIKTRDGQAVIVKVADDARLATLSKTTLADIKATHILALPECRSRTGALLRFRSTRCPRVRGDAAKASARGTLAPAAR